MKCENCNNEILDGMEEQVGTHTLCQDCYGSLRLCAECNSLVNRDEAKEYNDDWVCPECYDRHIGVCECCEESYDRDDDGAWGGMCESCADEHFVCDGCEETYSNDDYGEDGLCQQCYEKRGSGLIKDYHSGANHGITFHPSDSEPLYFGVELETDKYGDRGRAAEELTNICEDDALFWLEEDQSLYNGIEIISQPCTLAYHRDSFPWARIAEIVTAHGGQSHDTITCGLHIHFNRTFFASYPDLFQLRLIYLFEKFWDELVKFSRRDTDQLQENANKYGRPLFDCSAKRKVEELRSRYSRYQAVNISNRHTIEIRIFRGTLNINTLLASLELVDFLVRLAKGISTAKLQELTWEQLVHKIGYKEYRYLPAYLQQMNLA